MSGSKVAEIFPENDRRVRSAEGEEVFFPPWLFQHEELAHDFEGAKGVDREALTHTLNHIQFMDGHILVHLRHPKYQDSIFVRAHPGICLGKELTCCWSDENLSGLELESYQFLHLVIDNGLYVVFVPGVLRGIDRNYLLVELPPTSYAVGYRKARRHTCEGVQVELIQRGFEARGELVDFSGAGFRIRVSSVLSGSFHWFNPEGRVTIHLRRGNQIFFSGLCRFIRQRDNTVDKEMVLFASDEGDIGFKKKLIRNPRRHLVPSPTVILKHPFLKKKVQLEVSDISNRGMSVYERPEEGILMEGLFIPELIIDFAGALSMKCSAQVIYRSEEGEKGIRCGLAFLDMDINTYSRLTHIITHALDSHAYVSGDVDMDELWEFFFESGFIYPMKNSHIQPHREAFKRTYQKLYQGDPEIATHFTYQQNGRIYGHMSMVRAYDKAWLLHHHAARPMDGKSAGFQVLRQISHYLNDMYRLPSVKTEYVMCYFRPENKFPNRVYGGFARAAKDPRVCSMDLFSYLTHPCGTPDRELPEGWSLKEFSPLDLWELNRFYMHYSGGLLLDMLNLGQEDCGDKSLEESYGRLGFLRKWRAYSLKSDKELCAVLIVNQSDPGLNLSDILNGIKVLVTNSEELPWEILSLAISRLTGVYHLNSVPVLLYPIDYVKAENVSYEKQYQLLIWSAQFIGQFIEYMERRYRIKYWQ